MKRVWLCVGILSIIVFLSVSWLACLMDRTKEMSKLLDNCLELSRNGSDKTAEAIEEISDYWESFYRTASLFENSISLNNISDSVARLMPLYENGSDELYAECEVIRASCDRIFMSNMPFVVGFKAD